MRLDLAPPAKERRLRAKTRDNQKVRHALGAAALAILVAWAAGCAPGPLDVQTIQLGRSLNPDHSVGDHATLFKPHDTIYVSILNSGSGAGTIKVRWMYGSRVVDEPEKTVSYQGASATEFHLQGTRGFPAGDYSVEVFVDGVSVGHRAFRVDDDRVPK